MDENKKDGKRLLLLLIASISIIVLIFCIVKLTIYKLSSFKATNDVKKLEKEIDNAVTSVETNTSSANNQGTSKNSDTSVKQLKILDKYASLHSQNSDFSGWIRISGTNVSYPVMKNESDAEYYLHRNFEKEYSDEGLPFIDERCSIKKPSTNIIIYGHNMKNGDMFADLLKYEDKEYYQKHSTISFDTLYSESEYQIISVFRTDVSRDSDEDFRFYEFTDETYAGELASYLKSLKEVSIYSISFDESKVSELLTLSTCEYTKKDGRFVVVAAKVK